MCYLVNENHIIRKFDNESITNEYDFSEFEQYHRIAQYNNPYIFILYTESFRPNTDDEQEFSNIVFKSIKNITQLARCKLDNRTSVRYNIKVAILERVRMEGYGNG